jgi:hypothetical protein
LARTNPSPIGDANGLRQDERRRRDDACAAHRRALLAIGVTS